MAALEKNCESEPHRQTKERYILIVDDSKLQRRILSAMVKKWGYQVCEAEDAIKALALCEERMPDMVISDWMMPGMDGPEFCRAFKEKSCDAYGYFILLTSKAEKDEVAHGLDSGADDFLTKPVNAHELRARMTAGERVLRMEEALKEKNILVTKTLDELQRVYDALDQDLIEAKQLQQSLLREKFRMFDNAQISLFLRSSGHVGGDLVGFFPAGDGKLGFYGIDVSGHGISSALMTARLDGYLSSASPEQNIALKRDAGGAISPKSPAAVLEHLNTLVLTEMETEHYFTILLGHLDLKTGHVTAAQAGHPHPCIINAEGARTFYGPGGIPVGLINGVQYEEFSIKLEPGDKLLVCSDGVTECTTPQGDMLEETGLETLLKEGCTLSGEAIFEYLIQELTEFAQGHDFGDDISGLYLEFGRGSVACG